jgi:hypothetical protein
MKIQDLKEGDLVRIVDGGEEKSGTVVGVTRDENLVCVNNGIQEFWYPLSQIAPIPLTEKELLALGFEKVQSETGAKYGKGPFRVLVNDPGNYTNLEVWYREDRRHFNHPLYVHELQNLHLDMTKVHLEKPVLH